VPTGLPETLPTTFTGGTILYKQVRESDIGRDVNEDGDMDDVVTLVDGDSDGDGVLDSQDGCPETPNPDQRDSDGDGLQDACDPNPYCGTLTPPAPPVPPTDAEPCQKAIANAIRKLFATQAKATRACLDKITLGKLAGEPTALCRGGAANGAAILPGDAKTALKIGKAVAKVAATATAKCAGTVLTELQACATDAGSLAQCTAAAGAEGVAVATDLAYGEVGPIVDPAALQCQKTIGQASGKYLASVVKAMGGCLDKLNAGKLSGSGDTLCIAGETGGGTTLPSDPATSAKIQRAGDALLASLQTGCPGTAAAGLHTCGTDATSLQNCLTCTHVRQAIAVTRATYGP
jgi:hypothetical protein